MTVPRVVAAASSRISTTAKRTEQNRFQVCSKKSRRGLLSITLPAGGAGGRGFVRGAAGALIEATVEDAGFFASGIRLLVCFRQAAAAAGGSPGKVRQRETARYTAHYTIRPRAVSTQCG